MIFYYIFITGNIAYHQGGRVEGPETSFNEFTVAVAEKSNEFDLKRAHGKIAAVMVIWGDHSQVYNVYSCMTTETQKRGHFLRMNTKSQKS